MEYYLKHGEGARHVAKQNPTNIGAIKELWGREVPFTRTDAHVTMQSSQSSPLTH